MANASEVKDHENLGNSETVKNDESLKNLIKEINELKDEDNGNDKIE
jgi:hypothetical protein